MRARAVPGLILALWLALTLLVVFAVPIRAGAGDVGALREMLAELKLDLQEATAMLARDVQVEAMLEAVFDARDLLTLAASDVLSFAEEGDTVLDEDTLLLIKDAYDIITEILEELDFTVDFILPGLGEMLQEFAEKKADFERWIDPDQLGRKRARLILRSLAGADKVLDRIEDAKRLENLERLLDEDIRQPLEDARDLLHDLLEDEGWLGPLALPPDLDSNSIGADSSCALSNTISISAANLPPKADFTFAPEFPEVNQEVQFTDRSSDPDGSVTAWKWEFDDGTTSTERHPKHKFGAKRKYNVKLTVTDNGGATNSITKVVPVGFKPPVAKFTYSPERPKEGQPIQFTDQSTDPDGTVVAWSWDFGDGNGSSTRNPKYVYAKAGSYKVRLTVTDNDGFTNTYTATVTVVAPPELEEILEILDEADMLLEAAEGQLARAIRMKTALGSDFKRIGGFLLRIDRSLQVRERLDRRSGLGDLASSPSASAVTAEVRASPGGSGVEFRVKGPGVMAGHIQVRLFDLAGRAILERKANSGSVLLLRPLDQGGAPLANGVYLYEVAVYSSDGKRLWSEIGKLIILR